MQHHLTSYLDKLQPWMSGALIPETFQKQLKAIGRGLPPLSLGAFECWLGKSDRVDLNILVNPRINEHRTIKNWQREHLEGEGPEHEAVWARVQYFCRVWDDPDFFLKPLLGEMWIIYDLNDLNDPIPVPWLYVSFLHTMLDNNPTVKAETAIQTLKLLKSGFSPEMLGAIHRLLCEVPANFRVPTVAIKTTERGKIFRHYVEIPNLEMLADYLVQENWPGDVGELKSALEPWTTPAKALGLTLDFDGTVHPRIGIECHFYMDKLQENLDDMTRRLVDAGLCTMEKRDGLMAWNGRFEMETGKDFWSWPDRIANHPETIPDNVTVRRMVPYIKMLYEPGGAPLVAKAYLFYLRPVLRDQD